MAAPTTRHRPKVESRRRGSCLNGGSGFGFQFRCSCGRSGPVREVRSLATHDRDQHLTGLPAVAPDERCQAPREHDVKPWEPCRLCADQLGLFELSEAVPGTSHVGVTRPPVTSSDVNGGARRG